MSRGQLRSGPRPRPPPPPAPSTPSTPPNQSQRPPHEIDVLVIQLLDIAALNNIAFTNRYYMNAVKIELLQRIQRLHSWFTSLSTYNINTNNRSSTHHIYIEAGKEFILPVSRNSQSQPQLPAKNEKHNHQHEYQANYPNTIQNVKRTTSSSDSIKKYESIQQPEDVITYMKTLWRGLDMVTHVENLGDKDCMICLMVRTDAILNQHR